MSAERTLDPATNPVLTEPDDWPVVLDGDVMRAGEAMIPANDDGLIRGDGAFDAFPVRDGRPFARSAHLDRLERSCQMLMLEGPTCSTFWVRDGRLRTPALETGILASITRRVLLENLSVEEGSFALQDAAGADEAFLASTARWAQPIAAIGEVILPAVPGPQTLRAKETIEQAMAQNSIA